MNSGIFAKRGFKAVKDEEERREKVRELKKGKLFRFYVPKDKATGKLVNDIPVTFLTEEPINFWEHSIPQGGNKFINVPCTGDDCPHCEKGKPSFKSAWLIIDHTEYTYKDTQTQQEKRGKDRIKLLVRGMTDAAILENKSAKFGLMNYDWTVTKVGTGTSSSMQFERGERISLTKKQIDAIMSQLPENLRDLDPYDIVEKQIMSDLEVDATNTPDEPEISDEELNAKVMDGVQDIDGDETTSPKKMPRKKVK